MMFVSRFLAWLLLIVMPLEALAAASSLCCSPGQRAMQADAGAGWHPRAADVHERHVANERHAIQAGAHDLVRAAVPEDGEPRTMRSDHDWSGCSVCGPCCPQAIASTAAAAGALSMRQRHAPHEPCAIRSRPFAVADKPPRA